MDSKDHCRLSTFGALCWTGDPISGRVLRAIYMSLIRECAMCARIGISIAVLWSWPQSDPLFDLAG